MAAVHTRRDALECWHGFQPFQSLSASTLQLLASSCIRTSEVLTPHSEPGLFSGSRRVRLVVVLLELLNV